jgi:alpha-mannosidase
VILRLYESMGGRATTRIQTSLPVKKVFKTNILEDDLDEVEFEDVEVSGMAYKQVAVVLRAFEVGAFRLQL